MKTLNSVSFVNPSEKSVFTLIGEEVVECRIDNVTFIVEDGEDGVKRMVVSHYDIANNEGQITSLPGNAAFFHSMDDFRAGNPIEKMCEKGHNVLNNAIRNHRNDKWYFNGVEAAAYEPVDHITKVVLDTNCFNVTEGFVPDEIFRESVDVYAYNDIPTVDIDGNKGVKKGFLSPLLFNDKQKEIMERFKAISKEMREAKIEMLYIEGDLLFINGEHTKGYMVSYDRSDDAVNFFAAKEHSDHFLRMDFDCWDPACVELN